MSRIGKKPIIIEEGVSLKIEGRHITAAGPKGGMEVVLPQGLSLHIEGSSALLKAQEKIPSSLLGLMRSLISNAVYGVKNGWSKTLELVGVGYRAEVKGGGLILHLGFSHPVEIPAPSGISFTVSENKITVSGVDKYKVGEMAAGIRSLKPPEPYKGKGIKYLDEKIRKKLGKAAKAVGAAGAK